MPEYTDEKYSTGKRPQGWAMAIEHTEYDQGIWDSETGLVTTPFGLVWISTSKYYNKTDQLTNGSSRLNFVYMGQDYTREFKKNYSPRYLVTQAMAFVKEITQAAG